MRSPPLSPQVVPALADAQLAVGDVEYLGNKWGPVSEHRPRARRTPPYIAAGQQPIPGSAPKDLTLRPGPKDFKLEIASDLRFRRSEAIFWSG